MEHDLHADIASNVLGTVVNSVPNVLDTIIIVAARSLVERVTVHTVVNNVSNVVDTGVNSVSNAIDKVVSSKRSCRMCYIRRLTVIHYSGRKEKGSSGGRGWSPLALFPRWMCSALLLL